MKCGQVLLFIAVVLPLAAAKGDLLANELSFAASVIEKQLRQDKAPEQLRKQEAALLSKAEATIDKKDTSAHGRGASFLANHASMHSSTAMTLAAKVSQEVAFAEKAVEVQLEQDHAPATLVQEEKGLLEKAAAVTKDAAQMTRKSFALQEKERSLEKKMRIGHAAARTSKSEGTTAQQLVVAEQAMVKAEGSRIHETEHVEEQAQEALKKVHASSATQGKVADLLAEVEKAERSELSLSKHSVQTTQQFTAEFKGRGHHKKHDAVAANGAKLNSKTAAGALKAFASQETSLLKDEEGSLQEVQAIEGDAKSALMAVHASSETQKKVNALLATVEQAKKRSIILDEKDIQGTNKLAAMFVHSDHVARATQAVGQGLGKLESENEQLHAENAKLLRDHTVLAHEEKLVKENAALEKSDVVLRSENDELKEQLGNLA